MERVLGIGGVFLKARDPKALADWYRVHLGVPIESGQTYGMMTSAGSGEPTVWSAFPAGTGYFGPRQATLMVNYRVMNLDAMLAQLRTAGAQRDIHRHEMNCQNTHDSIHRGPGWTHEYSIT
jgi:hypothetical protein